MTANGLVADLDVLRSRIDVVEAVRTAPRHKPALEAMVNRSRSTITRAVRELEDAGMLRREDEGYALTLYGELLYERYKAFLEDTGDVADARSLFEALPATAPIDRSLVATGEICRSQPPAPYEPLSRVDRLLESTRRLEAISRRPPGRTTGSLLLDRIEDGLRGHAIVDCRLYDHLIDRFPDAVASVRTVDDFELSVTSNVPYELLAFTDVDADAADSPHESDDDDRDRDDHTDGDDRVVLVVFDDSDDLRGTITSEDPAAIEWARDLIERYRRQSNPAGPADEDGTD